MWIHSLLEQFILFIVDENVINEIGKGLCVLVGITSDDTEEDIEYITKKITTLRLFEDESGKMWKKSVQDLDLDILCVSQFTLYAKCGKSKPDFHMAMPSKKSREFYQSFLEKIRSLYNEEKVKGVYTRDITNCPISCHFFSTHVWWLFDAKIFGHMPSFLSVWWLNTQRVFVDWISNQELPNHPI